MTAASDGRDRLLMLLGRLDEGLAGVREDIQEIKAELAKDRRDAGESRRLIHDKLEDSERRLMQLESTVRITAEVVDKQSHRLDKIEPAVRAQARKIRLWTVQGGVLMASLAATGGFIWWLLTTQWDILVKVVQVLFQQPSAGG